ncbi:MAG: hypothetical protein ACK4V8_03755 [Moraxella osloensis]
MQRFKPLSNLTFKRHIVALALWGIGSLGYAASRPTVSAPVKPPVKSATSVAAKTNKTALTPAITQAIAGVNPTAVPVSVVNTPDGIDGGNDDNLMDDGADDGGEVDITSTAPIVTNPAISQKTLSPSRQLLSKSSKWHWGQYHPSQSKNLSK